MTPPKLSFLTQNQGWGSKKSLWGPLKVIKTSILHPKKEKKQIFSKNWTYMIWLSTVWDSHSTQLQGPTGRFDGQFIKLKICFQPGVLSLISRERLLLIVKIQKLSTKLKRTDKIRKIFIFLSFFMDLTQRLPNQFFLKKLIHFSTVISNQKEK